MRLPRTMIRLGALAIVLAFPSALLAQGFERPPSFAVAKIPGLRPSAENYTIKDPVRSDGILRIYSLTMPYGDLSAHGDHLLRMRLNELAALRELEKVSGPDTFAKVPVEALTVTGTLGRTPVARSTGETATTAGVVTGVGVVVGAVCLAPDPALRPAAPTATPSHAVSTMLSASSAATQM